MSENINTAKNGNHHKSLRIAVEGNIASGKSSIIRYLQTKFEMPPTTTATTTTTTTTQPIIDDITKQAAKIIGNEMSPRKMAPKSSENMKVSSQLSLKVLTEPVHLWRNLNGANLFDLMYADPIKWAYPFQSYVQLTMLQNHLELAAHGPNDLSSSPAAQHYISIMERSLFSARYCFAENLYRNNLIKPVEYEILDRWFNWMIHNHDCQLDIIFYLRTKPETCLKRLHNRGRHEEMNRINLDYLTSLHELHEQWLNAQEFAAATAERLTSSDSDHPPQLDLLTYYKPGNVIIIDADQSIDQVYKTIEHETRNAAVTMVI